MAAADRMIQEHSELYNAIRARDIERARTIIRMHCTEWYKDAPDNEPSTQQDEGAQMR